LKNNTSVLYSDDCYIGLIRSAKVTVRITVRINNK